MTIGIEYHINQLGTTHGKKHWSAGRYASLIARIKLAHGGQKRSPHLQRFLTTGTLAAIAKIHSA